MNVFGCRQAPNTTRYKARYIFMYILGIILMPFYILLGFTGLAYFGTQKMLKPWKTCIKHDLFHGLKKISRSLIIFLWLLFLPVVWLIFMAAGAVFIAILLAPIYFYHTYFFIKTGYWWNRPRENAK